MRHADSAAGPSRLKHSDINRMDPDRSKMLWLFNSIRQTGNVPKSWSKYNSLMLFKKPAAFEPGQDKIFSNFRPIALLDTVYKILTSIIATRLQHWLKTNDALSPHQRAIFGNDGVAENGFMVRSSLDRGQKVAFLDLTDAFGSVDHRLIRTSLEASQCPS